MWIPEGICAGEGRCGNIGSSKHGYYYTINPSPKRERYEQDIAYPLDTIDQEVKALSLAFSSLCSLANNLDSIKPLSLSMSRGTRIAHTIKSLRVSLMHQLDVLDAFSIVTTQVP